MTAKRWGIAVLAAVLPVLFLIRSLRPGFGPNFIPFSLHQSLFRDALEEGLFIQCFNIFVAVILFILIHRLLARWMRRP